MSATEAEYCSTYCQHNSKEVCPCQPCAFIRVNGGITHAPDCPWKASVLLQYTIYRDPKDLKPGYAVREWVIGGSHFHPGPVIAEGLLTLADARDKVPDSVDAVLQRADNDDPTIVETWF